jgi:hypothetical protein
MVSVIGYLMFGVAILIALLNFYLSFIRAPLCWWRKKEYKHISGFPLVGNLFLFAALQCVDHTSFTWALALVILALDTGGIPWFILSMLWMGGRHVKSEDHPKQ